MSDVVLLIRNSQITHPKESSRASQALECAIQSTDSRVYIAANHLFASLLDTANTTYYTISTILGTVKRYPTQGRKEAGAFLNKEGTKALHSAIFAAFTFFFFFSSFLSPNWTRSFLKKNSESPQPPSSLSKEEYQHKLAQALLKKDTSFQIDFTTVRSLLEQEQQNEQGCGKNYYNIFMERYKADFSDPTQINNIYSGMKKILAAIAYMRGYQYNTLSPLIQSEYRNIPKDIVQMKSALDHEKQQKAKETQKIHAEQEVELIISKQKDRLQEKKTNLEQQLQELQKKYSNAEKALDIMWDNLEQKATQKLGGQYLNDSLALYNYIEKQWNEISSNLEALENLQPFSPENLSTQFNLLDFKDIEAIQNLQTEIKETIEGVQFTRDQFLAVSNVFRDNLSEEAKAECGEKIRTAVIQAEAEE